MKKLERTIRRKVTIIGLLVVLALTGSVSAQVQVNAATTVGINEEVARAITERFNTEHPDIHVTLDAIPWTSIFDRMMVEFATGQPSYDVFWHSMSMLPTFIRSGYLEPLDEYFENTELVSADFDLSDFPESLMPRVDGNLYHLPYMTGPQIVFYRKDLLEQANLEVPQTLDEFLAAVQQLHNPAEQIYGTVTHGVRSGAGGNTYSFYPILFSMGGQILDGEGQVAIDDPVAVEALEYWLELYRHSSPESVNYGAGAASESMMAGNVAIMYTYADHHARFKDPERSQIVDEIAWAPFPQGPAGAHPIAHVWSVSISRFSSDEKKDATFRYITYLLDQANMEAYAKAGGVPPRNSALTGELAEDRPAFTLSAQGLETAVGVPLIAEYIRLEEILSVALSEVLAGTTTPENALNDAAQQMRRILRQ